MHNTNKAKYKLFSSRIRTNCQSLALFYFFSENATGDSIYKMEKTKMDYLIKLGCVSKKENVRVIGIITFIILFW